LASPFSIALTTVASESKAREIAKAALEARLAACAQLFPIKSLYVWKDELREDAEFALHLKIRAEDFAALQALIRQLHDYETPEILKIDIAEGDKGYMDWMAACLRK
jgi:periplasmic divalent cation tolerance protein